MDENQAEDLTGGAGAPEQEQTTATEEPEAGTAAGPHGTIRLKVDGNEFDWDLNDPRTSELLQKGHHYSDNQAALKVDRENLQGTVQIQAEAIARDMVARGQQDQGERDLAELREVDPMAADLKVATNDIETLKSQQAEYARENQATLNKMRWDQERRDLEPQHPNFTPNDWDRAYAGVIANDISLRDAATSVETERSDFKKKVIEDYTAGLRKNASEAAPASGSGAGTPINPGETKFKGFKSQEFQEEVARSLERIQGG